MELRILGGIYTEKKEVILYSKVFVPTLLNFGDIASKFLDKEDGIYFIPGEEISNFDYQFIVVKVKSRIHATVV